MSFNIQPASEIESGNTTILNNGTNKENPVSSDGKENNFSCINQTPEEHIKRPMNAFMVYAKQKRKQIAKKNPKMHNSQISKEVGIMWKSLTPNEQLPYKEEAERIRIEHKAKYPNYKFRPERRSTKKRSLPQRWQERESLVRMAQPQRPVLPYQRPCFNQTPAMPPNLHQHMNNNNNNNRHPYVSNGHSHNFYAQPRYLQQHYGFSQPQCMQPQRAIPPQRYTYRQQIPNLAGNIQHIPTSVHGGSPNHYSQFTSEAQFLPSFNRL